jgi:hypothetical protein
MRSPRQRAPLAGDLVAQVGQLLLVRHQRPALGDPAVLRNDGMLDGRAVGAGGRDGRGGGCGVHGGCSWAR